MGAKEIIEQTPQIGELEMQWLRGKPGELFPWALERSRDRVKGCGIPNKRFRSRMHSHTTSAEGTPSLPDLSIILSDLRRCNIRSWHIVSLGKMGNIEGYFSIRATRKLLEVIENPTKEENELFEKIKVFAWCALPKDEKARIKEELMEKFYKLGLSVRSTPMEGYIFNHKRFVKK